MRSLRFLALLLAISSVGAVARAAAEGGTLGVRAEVADDGLRITAVRADGPAAVAGLKVGDVLRELAGRPVRTFAELGRALSERRPGDVVVFLVRRGERSTTMEVRLGGPKEGPWPPAFAVAEPVAEPAGAPAAAPGPASERPFLGVEVSQARRGLRIEAVRPQGPAASAGIEVGDVLHGIGDAPVATLDDLQRVLAKHRVGERVTITVERDGSDRRLDLEFGSRGRPAVASVDGPAAAVLAPARDGLRVERAGDLAGARLERGDVVTHVDDREVRTRAEIDRRLSERDGASTLVVRRDGRALRLPADEKGTATDETAATTRDDDRVRADRGDRRERSAAGRDRPADLGLELAPSRRGLKVESVRPGGVAAALGLRAGDEVLKVGERPTPTRADFDRAVREAEGPVTLAVLRDGARLTLDLAEARERAAGSEAPRAAASPGAENDPGIAFDDRSERARVASVRPGSAAERAGLREGDVVTHVSGRPLQGRRDLEAALDAAARDVVGRLIVRVERAGARLELPLDVPHRERSGDARAGETAASVVAFGATGRTGVVLVDVEEGGTAARFGLRRGDVVVALDGVPVTGAAPLVSKLESSRPRVLTLVRDGREVELALRPAAEDDARPWLGVELRPTASGLDVTAVRTDGPAARAGLRVGDRVTALGGAAVSSSDSLAAALARLRPGARTAMTIERDGRSLDLTIVLGRREG